MGNHWHCCEKQIISISPNSLLVYALFIVQVQVSKFFTDFIKGHKVLHIIYNVDAWQ